ncbi:unnamed protein product [Rotaria magnacalcarata]|uniref:Uncharacterized protein n=1 Tax=Rotaria magnacalcarata TaxID=392030 RepID=A0A819EZD5_9BILA|nr:unnamed protein product [Rotaria magnacalcarata]CAF2152350.1 unnamed protein product [Rotaria magnacalcarata]CAF3841149.1 unnamed protein product [Rotaria magnacalcarata]CAF3859933.1 unnamed protein product [Rotaria magnacalcarata]
MLCNEGHRQALKARKERDKTQYREYTGDLGHPLLYAFVPDHTLLSDDDSHTQLLNCNLFDALDYKFQLSSLPDLKHESYQIDGDLNFAKKEKLKYKLNLDEIQLNDSDYDSELNDIDRFINKQDPIQVYRQACKRYQIHPYHSVIEGLSRDMIDLSEMSINDLDLKAICLALRIHTQMKYIRLSANNITAQGCAYLQETLKDNYKIEELDISKNPIRTEGIEILSLLFINDETKISIIKILNLSSCELIDLDGPIIRKIIQGGDMLQELYLSGNQLGAITCKNIGLVLKDAPELRILDLSWNMIRDYDIRPICNSLKNNQSLERLDLTMNGLGNQGAILIAKMLSSNETLIELDMSNNRIEKDGADIFASKLEMNRRLKKLWFGNNNFGTLGSLVLLKAIDHIKSQVEYLNIENVLVNDDFLDLYTQINQYLRSLEVVHGGIRGRLGRIHSLVPGFTIMDDIDLRFLDTKSLHAMFQRDPFKILGRMAKEGRYDFLKALKKWDLEEHGHLTYSIYIIDFPSAIKDAGINLDKTLHFILWNYLKKIAKRGSVSYLQFITPLPKLNLKASIQKKQKSVNIKK